MADIETPAKTAEPAAPAAPVIDIQKIIAEALAEQRKSIMAEVAATLAGRESGSPNDMVKVLSDLTAMIADTTNVHGNRKTVPPEEMRRREAAQRRMGELLTQARAQNLKAHYEIVAQTWLEGQLIQPFLPDGEGRWRKNEVIWGGAPNNAMRPINDVAKKIFDAFLESIGGSTQVRDPNGLPLPEKGVWLTYGGLAMVGDTPPQSMANRGNVRTPAPMELAAALPTTNELTSPDDPNATKIPILGTTFPPAERVDPGAIAKLNFAR